MTVVVGGLERERRSSRRGPRPEAGYEKAPATGGGAKQTPPFRRRLNGVAGGGNREVFWGKWIFGRERRIVGGKKCAKKGSYLLTNLRQV